MGGGDTANHLTAVFKLLDIDGSGFIEEAEGMKVGKALGYSPVFEYWEELKKLDSDGDGKISLDEFLQGNAAMDAKKAVELKERMETKLANLAVQNGGLPPLNPKAGGLAPLKPLGGGGGGGLPPLGSSSGPDPAVAEAAKAAFTSIDKDASGGLDKEEVFHALKSLCDEGDAESIGILTAFIETEYAKADRDLNGKLDLKEFTGVYATFANTAAMRKK